MRSNHTPRPWCCAKTASHLQRDQEVHADKAPLTYILQGSTSSSTPGVSRCSSETVRSSQLLFLQLAFLLLSSARAGTGQLDAWAPCMTELTVSVQGRPSVSSPTTRQPHYSPCCDWGLAWVKKKKKKKKRANKKRNKLFNLFFQPNAVDAGHSQGVTAVIAFFCFWNTAPPGKLSRCSRSISEQVAGYPPGRVLFVSFWNLLKLIAY